MFGAYLYSAGTQHGNLHPAGCRILFYGSTQDPVLATANTGKIWRGLEKMQVNGLEKQKWSRKNSLAVSVAFMAIYWPTSGFKVKTYKLCVLNTETLISASAAPHCGKGTKRLAPYRGGGREATEYVHVKGPDALWNQRIARGVALKLLQFEHSLD